MPTSLPVPKPIFRSIDLIVVFALALAIAFFAIEIADPAPMNSDAAEFANL